MSKGEKRIPCIPNATRIPGYIRDTGDTSGIQRIQWNIVEKVRNVYDMYSGLIEESIQINKSYRLQRV
jgi:hypothetical protein